MGSLKVRTDSISGRIICHLGYPKEEALLQPRNGNPTPESLQKRTGSFLRNTETKDSAQLGNGFVLEYEDEEKFAAASGVKSLADSWPKSKSRFLRESLKILSRSCTGNRTQNNYFVDYLLQHYCIYFLCSLSKIPLKSVDRTSRRNIIF